MDSRMLKRFTAACWVASTIVFVVAPLLLFPFVQRSMPTGLLAFAASAVLVMTFALQAAYVVSQLDPEARRAMPLGRMDSDTWVSVLAATMMPAVCWNSLVPLSHPAFSALRSAVPWLAISSLVLGAIRLYQIRRVPAL